MSDPEVTLYFYLEPERFPYKYLDNLNLKNEELVREMAPSTWWSWTLQTYLQVRDHFNCILVDQMPEEGIIFFFRGSIGFFDKPSPKQFWVCFVGDSTWHAFSHINIFQNPTEAIKWPNSFFIRHWPQQNLIARTTEIEELKNIYFFGNQNNLADELKNIEWLDFVQENNLQFHIPMPQLWNDYSKADLVVGVRSFNSKEKFNNKPSTKLMNAVLAGTPFIGGKENALLYEKIEGIEFIEVASFKELKEVISNLRKNPKHLKEIRQSYLSIREKYSNREIRKNWIQMIDSIISKQKKYSNHFFFILERKAYTSYRKILRKILTKN